jgi:tetratricopeptide (TPR) repeat protein
LDAQQPLPLLVRARVLSGKGNNEQALKDCNAALKIAPQLPWGYSTLGVVLLATGGHDDAVKALSKALQLAPDDAESYATRGRAFLALRYYRSAINDLDRAVALDPSLEKELAAPLAELKNRR